MAKIKKLQVTTVTVAQRYNFPIISKKQDKKQPLLKRFKRGLFLVKLGEVYFLAGLIKRYERQIIPVFEKTKLPFWKPCNLHISNDFFRGKLQKFLQIVRESSH